MDINLALGIAGIALSIAAIPFSYYLGRRNRQRPDLCFSTDFDVLMSPKAGLTAEGLALTFNGKMVTRVSRTYLAVWNDSGDPVKASDVVVADPLRISVDEQDTVLQVRVVAQSRSQCGIKVERGENADDPVAVRFDFLDAKDGAIFEVLHHGQSAAFLEGTIRGAKLRDRGISSLHSSALAAVNAKSFFARLSYAFSGNSRRPLVRLALMFLIPLTLGAIAITTSVVRMTQSKNVVPLRDFDMTTVEGQENFLQAASKAGLYSQSSAVFGVVSIGVFVLMIAALIFLLLRMTRAKIPASITAIRLDDQVSSPSQDPRPADGSESETNELRPMQEAKQN